MRRIKLAAYFSVEELEQRYRQAHEGIERSHWQIIWLLAQEHPAKEVAELTGYSAYWIGQLAQRYNAEGAEALRNHRHQSRPSPQALLSDPEGLADLRAALAGPAPQHDVWNSRTVATWLSARAGRSVSEQTALTYLHRVGWTPQTPQTPRPRHIHAAEAADQETFKKRSPAR